MIERNDDAAVTSSSAADLVNRRALVHRLVERLVAVSMMADPGQEDLIAARACLAELRILCSGSTALRPCLVRGRAALHAVALARGAEARAALARRQERAEALARRVEDARQCELVKRRIVRVLAAAARVEQPSRFSASVRQCALLWRQTGPCGEHQRALTEEYRVALKSFWDGVRREHASARRLAAERATADAETAPWFGRRSHRLLSRAARGRVAGSMVAVLVSGMVLQSRGSAVAECFGPSDRSIVPVWQQAPPPRVDGQRNYRFYPVDVAATAQLDRLRDTRSSVSGAFWQWSNHGPRRTDGGFKGNITPGAYGVQVRFSSNEAADACTMAQTSALLGIDPRGDIARGHLKSTSTPQTSDTLDLCMLPDATLPSKDGVVLDYEVQDDRTAEQTKVFLSAWAALVKHAGHEAILYPNALDAPSQKRTNLPAVAADVAKSFDKVFVLLWSKNAQHDIARSFALQAETYKAPADKLLVAFELAGTSLGEARAVHDILAADKASGVSFWRNHAEQGGACDTDVNQKIACITQGRCGG